MMRLAVHGGTPTRKHLLPYASQCLADEDLASVLAVLKSPYLTTGPQVQEFEKTAADYVEAKHAVAVSSGTAALHAAVFALNIKPGDEVIVPAITFVATANCIVYQGATPVFADVDPDTLLIDPDSVRARITPKTRAIIAVDYAGQPCDYGELMNICEEHGLVLVNDAAHSLGSTWNRHKTGSIAHLTTFSFHPVKHITTGEGGVVTTDSEDYAESLRQFRNHGITLDHRQRKEHQTWRYDMQHLGFNYRITDMQCALGVSQLPRLQTSIDRRNEIAHYYDTAFSDLAAVTPLQMRDGRTHARHLYVIQLNLSMLSVDRDGIFTALRAEGIGVNVHYMPVYMHSYYRDRLGDNTGLCPNSESAFRRLLTLPIFPAMEDQDMVDVTTAVQKVIEYYLLRR